MRKKRIKTCSSMHSLSLNKRVRRCPYPCEEEPGDDHADRRSGQQRGGAHGLQGQQKFRQQSHGAKGGGTPAMNKAIMTMMRQEEKVKFR